MRKARKTKIKFIFEIPALQKKFRIQEVEFNLQKLNKLFPATPSSILINVFQDRSSFLKAIGKKKTPDWLVAYVFPSATAGIYILNNEDKLESRRVINQVLMHELAHLYTNKLNYHLPDWLKEGISVYISGQIFKKSISVSDWEKISYNHVPFKQISWRSFTQHNGYNIAGLMVMFFVKKYGWNRFITAIRTFHSKRFSIQNIPLYFGDKFEPAMADFKKEFVK